jgi:hypothetical protein
MPYTDSMPYLMTELMDCLEILYEILEDLEDIRIALEKGRDPDFFLFPNLGFDPFKTIGKYC